MQYFNYIPSRDDCRLLAFIEMKDNWKNYFNPTNRPQYVVQNHIFRGKVLEAHCKNLLLNSGWNILKCPQYLAPRSDGKVDITAENTQEAVYNISCKTTNKKTYSFDEHDTTTSFTIVNFIDIIPSLSESETCDDYSLLARFMTSEIKFDSMVIQNEEMWKIKHNSKIARAKKFYIWKDEMMSIQNFLNQYS